MTQYLSWCAFGGIRSSLHACALLTSCALLLASCSKDSAPTATQTATKSEPAVATQDEAVPVEVAHGPARGAQPAAIGKPAPGFTLPDLDGNSVSLSHFAGKIVVIEWFNPECPFVKKSHTVGSLVSLAKKHTEKGVVWLAINSGAPGKQGHGVDINSRAVQQFGLGHPVLLDESGAVGKLYGAKHTPHMFVVDGEGTLVYRGAIDNSPDGEGASPQGGTLVNYVEQALDDVAAERAVAMAETEAYGCSVKYAN